jgi:hypothetical protein
VVKEVWVTDKIKEDLDRLSKDKGTHIEGLACILLRLALSDEISALFFSIRKKRR